VFLSDSAAAPTAVRAAAPNDWRECRDAVLAAAVLAAAVLANPVLAVAVLTAAVAPIPQATAAANASAAISTRARRVCLGVSASVCSGLLTGAMLPTPAPSIKGRPPHMGRVPHLRGDPIDDRDGLCLWSR
jgi:hypothetical protein